MNGYILKIRIYGHSGWFSKVHHLNQKRSLFMDSATIFDTPKKARSYKKSYLSVYPEAKVNIFKITTKEVT